MKNAELRKKLKNHGYRNETIDKLIELKLLLSEEDDLPEPKTTWQLSFFHQKPA